MTPENVVRLTASIAIVLAFLEPAIPDERARQNLQEIRIRQVDEMLQGIRLVLQACGQCQYLQSLYTLWKDLAQGLWTLERQLWPEQAPDTELALALPIEKHALGEVLLPSFAPNVQYVKNAMQSLDVLYTWFTGCYDIHVQAPFNAVLEDALMIFRTIDTMFRLKARIIAAEQRGPIDLDPSTPAVTAAATATAASTNAAAASSNPAPEPPVELVGASGEPLQWF